MLIEFRVKNFGCLRDEQVLSLVPASDDKTLLENNTFETGVPFVPRLLRTAVIYGPNAGGKSTVLRALQTMFNMVISSASIETNGKIFPIPFLLDDVSRKAPTAFEVSFLHEGRRYQYGFSCQEDRILEEYLFEYKSSRPTTLFNRCYDREDDKYIYTFTKSLRGAKKVWRDATQRDVLFFSRAAQLNSEQLFPLFKDIFISLFVFNKFLRIPFNIFLKQIFNNTTLKENICNFIKSTDINIKDIVIQEELTEQNSDNTEKSYFLSFVHTTEYGEVSLPAWAESDGTMQLFYYLTPLLDIIDLGGVLAIDELDASLHPLMVRHIVELFQSPKTNPKGAQLIFTTHDTSLLQDMETLFRCDQVWFVEKDANQASHLYSLAEFQTEKDENFSLSYLHGLYGGIPILRGWEGKK